MFNVSGLPPGTVGTFSFPEVTKSGITKLLISIPPGLAPGAYPFTVGYSTEKASKSLNVTLTVLPAP